MTALRRHRSTAATGSAEGGVRAGDVVVSSVAHGGAETLGRLAALVLDGSGRRVLDTAASLDDVGCHPGVTYLGITGDPRDVAVAATSSPALAGDVALDDLLGDGADAGAGAGATSVGGWIDADVTSSSSLAQLVRHVASFWDRRDEDACVLFHHADLVTDLRGQLHRLAAVLDVPVAGARLAELTAAAAGEGADTAGRWRDAFGPDDLCRYDERLAALAPADLADWLHSGWLGRRVGWPVAAVPYPDDAPQDAVGWPGAGRTALTAAR